MAVSVSGALVGACRDGQISGTPRSSDGALLDVDRPAPGPLDVDEPTPSPANADEPAPGVTGVPYGHVTPADVGVTIGVGVVAPVPTEVYTGPMTITTAGTTIENVIINGRINLYADNITLRNVIINNNTASHTIRINENAESPIINNVKVEYSQINCTTEGKLISVRQATNVTVRNNEGKGCLDFHFMQRELDGFLSENNYYHSVTDSAGGHTDGYQIGSGGGRPYPVTTGTLTIRGNYFDKNNSFTSPTDLLFGAGSPSTNQTTVIMENNYFKVWGTYTLRCYDPDSCIIRNNVYAQEFKTGLRGDGNPKRAAQFTDHNAANSTYQCNRYEDGDFIEQQYITNTTPEVTHVTAGCPSY